MIHGHGSDAYKYEQQIVADFSSNVWYHGTPTSLLTRLREELQHIGTYPEPDSGKLQSAVAESHRLDKANVLVCNGSAEAIYLLARMLKKEQSILLSPTFAEYEDACISEQHQIKHITRNELPMSFTIPNSLYWICNPNNPDGEVLLPEEIEGYIKTNPTSTFIIDEAYVELCTENCSSVYLITRYQNLIILKSHTKAYTIPGLRLGYILGSPKIIKLLQSKLFPWNVNSLAIAAGLHICENQAALAPSKQAIASEMKVFRESMQGRTSIETYPTNTNYFLCKLSGYSASTLKDYLVRKHGILIRNASNFHGLSEYHIRLALQSPGHNELLIYAITKFEAQL